MQVMNLLLLSMEISFCKELSRQEELVTNQKIKTQGLPVRIRPENRPKGVKLIFECDHIAPSGFGVADQEGTDSYVLFGSNTAYV